jgi:hypothetical protein
MATVADPVRVEPIAFPVVPEASTIARAAEMALPPAVPGSR